MRIRTIKPEFFKDEELADLPAQTRLLFIGLWLMADRKGRLEDRPRLIKVELLPYEDVNVDELLTVLDKEGFIKRYTVDDKAYIEVVNFKKHQRIMGKESEFETEIPAPETREKLGNTREKSGSTREKLGNTREKSGSNGEALGNAGREGKGRERKGDGHALLPSSFEQFWSSYPRKIKKKETLLIWQRKNLDLKIEEILTGLNHYKQSEQWCRDGGKFIPHPTTWLNGERWNDEILQKKTARAWKPDAVNGPDPEDEAAKEGLGIVEGMIPEVKKN